MSLQSEIESRFAESRADELRQLNIQIQKLRDALAHAERVRDEILGIVDDKFAVNCSGEQDGFDEFIRDLKAA